MPDGQEHGPWEDYAPQVAAQAAEHGPWEDYGEAPKAQAAAPTAPKPPSATERFTKSFRGAMGFNPEGGVASDVSDIGSGFKEMATHPANSASLMYHGVVDPMEETARSGAERFHKPGIGNKIAGGAEWLESGVPLIGPWLAGAGHQVEQGDYAGAAGTMAPALIPGAMEHGYHAAERIPAALESRRLAQGPKNIETALATPAGKGGSRAAAMKEDIHVATADLAAIEKEAPAKVTFALKRGKGAENFHELAEKIDARQDEMWEKGHTPGIERHAETPINHNAVANAGRAVLTKEAVDAAPSEATAAQSWLEGIAKERNLKSADNLIREINDDLRGKGSETRYGPLQVRVRQAVVKALRGEVERALTDSGEEGVKGVNRRWGALENIKSRLRERAVQEAQREAKGGPIPDWVHLYSFMNPDMGLSLGAGVSAAKMLQPSASGRLTKGLRQLGRTSLDAPYEAQPPVGWGAQPKALLPAPPAIINNQMEPSVPGRSAVEAPRQTYRDVATGRMQRGYKGEMPLAVVGWTAEGGPIYEKTPPATPRNVEQAPVETPRSTPQNGDRRSSLRDIRGPEPMRTSNANALRAQLKDPTLPERDRVIIQAQLDDLVAHPFERAEGETDINRIKAAKEKRKTRAEAERSVEERKKGRRQRFGD